MSMTDIAVRAAKPREKPYKIADEKKLYLICKIEWEQIVATKSGPLLIN